MPFSVTIEKYYRLTKPGIIYGNLITATAGYLFASHWHIDFITLIAMLLGLSLVIGCGCVLNNIIDRKIDIKMERTKKRALITGDISTKNALIYGLVIGILGSIVLLKYTNALTFQVALFGLIFYLAVYGFIKRRSVYGTLIGAFAGAVPPVVGFTSVTNYLDFSSVLLFAILVCWQLSHFYAISLYRKDDYAAANLPVWPVIKGDKSTETQILGFIAMYTVFASSLFIFGYCGFLYLLVILITGMTWLVSSLKSDLRSKPKQWGRQVFLSSLIVLLISSVAISLGPIAP